MRQKIDGYAQQYLREIVQHFRPYFGEMTLSNEAAVFAAPPQPLSRVRIFNKQNKQLFGGIYSLQVVGEIDRPELTAVKAPIQIFYRGFIKKGQAYFRQKQDAFSEFVQRLNGHQELIATLTQLDLEFGVIRAVTGKYLVQLAPLGGSYLYMTFPPLRYPGVISKREISGLVQALRQLSLILQAI
ncbi:MAG: DUF3156 family protein [Bacillota bacterium]|jgi:hypothetical protein